MGFAEVAIALIVVGLPVSLGFWVIGRAFRHNELKLELKLRANAASTHDSAQNEVIQMLEQRVRVLERIVTDRGIGVADEIELLRAPQR
jgi:hypothetical protein